MGVYTSIIKTIAVLFFTVSFVINSTAQVSAGVLADCGTKFGVGQVMFNGNTNVPDRIAVGSLSSYELSARSSSFVDGDTYTLLWRAGIGGGMTNQTITTATVQSNILNFTVDQESVLRERGQKTLQLQSPSGDRCDFIEYDVEVELTCESISFSQAGFSNSSCLDTQSGPITVTVTGLQAGGQVFTDPVYLDGSAIGTNPITGSITPSNGTATYTITNPGLIPIQQGHTLMIKSSDVTTSSCQTTFDLQQLACSEEARTTPPTSSGGEKYFKLCDQILDTVLQQECRDCAGSEEQAGVWTAVGCINRDPVSIAQRLIEVGLGIGGGVALIMTLAGGFILSTSQGNPQKASQARELITNSIIGLLFVIFSVVILQFIGVTVLRIPGFGASTEQAP